LALHNGAPEERPRPVSSAGALIRRAGATGGRWDARSCQGRAWHLSNIEQHSLSLSDVDHRHDPVIAVDDDDLVTDDEVHVSTPFRLDVEDQLRNGDDSHAGRNGRADVD
jgi:hypothetical protein